MRGSWPPPPTTDGHDHGDVDHGLVVGGQGLVVADAAAMLGDPGQRPLNTTRALFMGESWHNLHHAATTALPPHD
jgi:hypothetical protein